MISARPTVRAGLATLAAPLLLAACDSPAGPGGSGGVELLFDRGVAVQVSDTAVWVDGAWIMGVPRTTQALWIGHETGYEYGGLGTYAPDRLWGEQRYVRFGHESREQRGDTLVFSFLDFGDVALAGDPMGKATEEPDASHAPYPVRFESFVIYHDATYAHQTYLDGREVSFVEAPHDQAIRTGGEVGFTATGGDAAAFETTIRPKVVPALTGLENGAPVDFLTTRPILDAGSDVVLTFDAALDPDAVVLVLFPWHQDVTDPAVRRAATAIGRLDRAASRVVIPGAVLGDLLDAADLAESGYLLYVIQFHHQPDAIATTRVDTGEPLSLPFVQTDHTRFFLRVRR